MPDRPTPNPGIPDALCVPDLDAPDAFAREDDSPDRVFFAAPRLVLHLDPAAIATVRSVLAALLPRGGTLLEVGASWKTHLPPRFDKRALVGLGMNAAELASNPLIDEPLVQDLNLQPRLPFPDAAFDAVFCTSAVAYLTRPVDVFAEVRRVLRPRRPFVVVFGRPCFDSRAVRVWREARDAQRIALARAYFERSDCPAGGWESITDSTYNQGGGLFSDPVSVVHAVADTANITLSAGASAASRRTSGALAGV